jgi:hypothetical protein
VPHLPWAQSPTCTCANQSPYEACVPYRPRLRTPQSTSTRFKIQNSNPPPMCTVQAMGIDVNKYTRKILMMPSRASCPWGGLAMIGCTTSCSLWMNTGACVACCGRGRGAYTHVRGVGSCACMLVCLCWHLHVHVCACARMCSSVHSSPFIPTGSCHFDPGLSLC